jgi:hypothetical protein
MCGTAVTYVWMCVYISAYIYVRVNILFLYPGPIFPFFYRNYACVRLFPFGYRVQNGGGYVR